jgi:hypothetical protein
MVCGLLAGVAYNHYSTALGCVLGFGLMILWHVMDGADGQLARLTHRQSATGKVLDGICDYVTFASVYVGLALPLSRLHGNWVWWLVATSGAFHAVQSAAYELQRQDYDHWGCGRPSAAPVKAAVSPATPTSWIGWSARTLDRLYIGVQRLSTGVDKTLRQEMEATVEHGLTRSDTMSLYREVFSPRVRQWSIMSANYRTLGLFVFALAGLPLYYFVWEIVALSVLTVVMLAGQRGLYRNFFMRARAASQVAL